MIFTEFTHSETLMVDLVVNQTKEKITGRTCSRFYGRDRDHTDVDQDSCEYMGSGGV